MSNQRWNSLVFSKVGIYNVNVYLYFNDMCMSTLIWTTLHNVKKNSVIFDVEFHNHGQRRNNVLTISNKNKQKSFQNEYTDF